MSAVAEETTTIIDGYIWNTETGECLGPVVEEGFKIDSEERANYILEKMLSKEALFASIDQTEEVTKARAVLANAEIMKKKALSELNGLHFRFDAELGAFAKPLFAKGTKYWQSLYGRVNIRSSKGAVMLVDENASIEFIAREAPKALRMTIDFAKVEEESELADLIGLIDTLDADSMKFQVMKSVIPEELIESLTEGVPEEELKFKKELKHGFAWEPPADKVTVETGVK